MEITDALKALGLTSFVSLRKIEIQYKEDVSSDPTYLCLHVSGINAIKPAEEGELEVLFAFHPVRLSEIREVDMLQWEDAQWKLRTINKVRGDHEDWIEIRVHEEGNFIRFHS
ncbi:MAG: hypothetical protein KAZ30_02235 [Candidatus Magasanikbacteria bacterium]|nr:hypothetical protein [Candidatus Magasanikbacteria bacterium]